MKLHLNAETYGFHKDIESMDEMKKEVMDLIDEDIIEISIKKRAVKDNSQRDFTKTCPNTLYRK